jgi:hypothetical protein
MRSKLLVPALALSVALSGNAFGQSQSNNSSTSEKMDWASQFGELFFQQTGHFGEDDRQNKIGKVSFDECGQE